MDKTGKFLKLEYLNNRNCLPKLVRKKNLKIIQFNEVIECFFKMICRINILYVELKSYYHSVYNGLFNWLINLNDRIASAEIRHWV